MEAIKYEDRIFELECGNCKALLKYQDKDIKTISTTRRINMTERDSNCNAVRFFYKDIPVIKRQLTCPVCGCENYIE